MRVKLVPPAPADLAAVAEAQRAVPLVPRPEGDCWPAVADRLGIERRDTARTWLTFLRGLGLVRRTPRGFVRTRSEPDRETLAVGLREGVFPAAELLEALDDEPTSAGACYEAIADRIPRWERERARDWEATWVERVGHLLDWLVLAGLAARSDGGYVGV